jgi:hypothetical protein
VKAAVAANGMKVVQVVASDRHTELTPLTSTAVSDKVTAWFFVHWLPPLIATEPTGGSNSGAGIVDAANPEEMLPTLSTPQTR